MNRKTLEVRDVFATLSHGFKARLSKDKRRVYDAIMNCRTMNLGAHLSKCTSCGYQEQSYNSCRNRHCPKCQGSVAAKWVDARAEDLLPVEYFHNVLTLASELRPVAYQNKQVVYDLMFRESAEALTAVGLNPRFLGAKLGFFSILHTWNQKIEYHPHVHLISPKGGISPDGTKWVAPKHDFFLPVRALSKVFRGKMIDALRNAYRQGELSFYGSLKHLEDPKEFEKLLASSRKSDWAVYSKKPFGGPTQVLKYLARYVHRVAISNHRLRKLKDDKVTFSYRDAKKKNKKRLLTLSTTTFSQRFLLHLLPRGFTRIRHYGFLATSNKKTLLPLVRTLITKLTTKVPTPNPEKSSPDKFLHKCPNCLTGILITIATFRIPHSCPEPSDHVPPFSLNFSPQTTMLN